VTTTLFDTFAAILRIYFDTEASRAGLRSPDFARAGGRSATTPDAAAVARVSRGSGVDHQRIRQALQALEPHHIEVLSLAFGVTLRNRDVDDTSRRRAFRTPERAWRVQLAELYGVEGAVALASPKARRLFEDHLHGLGEAAAEALPALEERVAGARPADAPLRAVLPAEARDPLAAYEHERAGGLVAWLIGSGKVHLHVIAGDVKSIRAEALAVFAMAYGTASTPKKRTRDMSKTRARILAFHAEDGQEIG
jgi:limonene-1,2-epoxide hydrolase